MGKCGPQPKVRVAWSDYGFDRTVYTAVKYRPYVRTSLPRRRTRAAVDYNEGSSQEEKGRDRFPAPSVAERTCMDYAFTGWLVTYCFQAIGVSPSRP
jgi:hypothetical protein